MKRLLAFVLLVGLTASCTTPLYAQQMSVAEYQRKSAKEAKKQQKIDEEKRQATAESPEANRQGTTKIAEGGTKGRRES